MSSVQSAYGVIKRPPTKFSALITPSYSDNTIIPTQTVRLPIPFTVTNQVLDINVEQSSAINTFVNNGTDPQQEATVQGKAFGGVTLINSFGPNMTTYLRNWIYNEIENENYESDTYEGPLVIYIQPVMTNVQMAIPSFANSGPFNDSNSWGITTEAPVSREYIGGGPTNNYFTAWIFKTPMTVRYVAPGGEYKYITMTSQFSED